MSVDVILGLFGLVCLAIGVGNQLIANRHNRRANDWRSTLPPLR